MAENHIVDPGGSRDSDALPLYTRKRSRIRNEQRPPALPERMRAAIEIMEGVGESVRCRSGSSTYNCVGLIFASRRTWIDPDQLPLIFGDDGYRRVTKIADLVAGDLVVYERDDEITHIGIVQQVSAKVKDGWEVLVLSQWGSDGEYLHLADDAHQLLGDVATYFTERRPCNDS